MIEKTGWGTFEEYELICDHCEGSVEGFDSFDEVVRYKKRSDWASVKGVSGDWFELCPECASRRIIEEYKKR